MTVQQITHPGFLEIYYQISVKYNYVICYECKHLKQEVSIKYTDPVLCWMTLLEQYNRIWNNLAFNKISHLTIPKVQRQTMIRKSY